MSEGNFTFSNGFTRGTEGGYFTINAIPEPLTVRAALGLACLLLWPARRRFTRQVEGSRNNQRPLSVILGCQPASEPGKFPNFSIRTREQASQNDVLACLADERNCERKTMDVMARSMVETSGLNPLKDHGVVSQAY